MADAMLYFGILLLFVSSLRSQETKHALTAEQCRADQQLWQDKLRRISMERMRCPKSGKEFQSIGHDLRALAKS